MKRNYVFRIGLTALLLFCCCGCVKFDGQMKISASKSMNLNVVYAVDRDAIDQDVLTENEQKKLLENGFKIEEYKDDTFEGVKLTYKVSNIDQISALKDVSFSLNSIRDGEIQDVFKVKKSWFFNHYKAHFTFDSTDVVLNPVYEEVEEREYLCSDGSVVVYENGEEVPGECYIASKVEIENAKSDHPLSSEELNEKLLKETDLSFSVDLASKAIHHNATDSSKNDTSLTWKLDNSGITNIEFEFSLLNYGHVLLTVVGCLVVVVLILVLVVFLLKFLKKRKK